ncbi:PH domain-containing protein [Bacillus cytotoxicus]|uniref:PH domain-containing protein n=1 Tax=Bacillus cytotoxicus TaxID=580165 RepID=UPI001AED78FB|nr:PH domain-containing protein [Bacillus cytotoxicus]MDH2860745.1 PH domain-containing protein [Bacillus cytotoxicus]MDH2870177.1 PH domain-containing protein [Bacillus cytotoxicus]MDH2873016.1 PH domain-containing protein [Bacillus cytotoxicus]QTR67904.1 PH domain-containing protein [Bacillus cytotoxicus]HDR7210770.1 PH domain-containing protein [Bacillus cytotoxicus]
MHQKLRMRNHPIELLYINFTKIKDHLYPLLTTLIATLGINGKWERFAYYGFAIFVIYILLKSFLIWKNNVFIFYEDILSVREGVWSKEYSDIHYTKVKSISIDRTFMKRILNVSNVNIETVGGDTIQIVVSNKKLSYIKSILNRHINEVAKETQNTNFFKLKDYILIATTNFKLFWGSILLTLTTSQQLIKYLGLGENPEKNKGQENLFSFDFTEDSIHINLSQDFKNDIQGLLLSSRTVKTILSFILAIFIIIMIAWCISIIITFFTYKNFKVQRSTFGIDISYGLIDKKEVSIAKHDIRAVEIVQPWIYRLFGYSKIHLQLIGNSSRKSKIVLIPSIQSSEVSSLFKKYLPDFSMPKCIEKVHTIAFLKPAAGKVIKIGLLMLVLWLFTNLQVKYGVLLCLYIFGMEFLKNKQKGFSFEEKQITIQTIRSGTVRKVIYLKKFIETTGVSENTLERKLNLATYEIAVFSERVNDVRKIRCATNIYKKKFLEYLEQHKEGNLAKDI